MLFWFRNQSFHLPPKMHRIKIILTDLFLELNSQKLALVLHVPYFSFNYLNLWLRGILLYVECSNDAYMF
jgi:hypothetical protein